MLWLVGLGLGDEKDVTLRGAEVIRACEKVYLEAYTSVLGVDTAALEASYGKKVQVCDREFVEGDADVILDAATKGDAAFLVVGDPFGATTHTDLLTRANDRGVEVRVVHNASIMNAVGCCGLQLYRFGETVSICYFNESWRPSSFYDKIAENAERGLHTLCLLDIKVKERNYDELLKGRTVFDPPRYMSVSTAIKQMLEIEEERGGGVCLPSTHCIGLARVGQDTQRVAYGTMQELLDFDMGGPLHSLVVVGETHFLEEECLARYRISPAEVESEPSGISSTPADVEADVSSPLRISLCKVSGRGDLEHSRLLSRAPVVLVTAPEAVDSPEKVATAACDAIADVLRSAGALAHSITNGSGGKQNLRGYVDAAVSLSAANVIGIAPIGRVQCCHSRPTSDSGVQNLSVGDCPQGSALFRIASTCTGTLRVMELRLGGDLDGDWAERCAQDVVVRLRNENWLPPST